MYAYCLFCNTQKSRDAAENLRQKYGFEVLIPRIVQRKWIRGVAHEEERDFLPSYLFVYSKTPIENPRKLQREYHILRCLGAPENDYVLQDSNLGFAQMLYDNGGTIGILKTYREGDRIHLVQGALGGLEGEIIRLDRNKGRAQIQYELDGAVFKTWVGYDLIDDPVQLQAPGTENDAEN